ncbi:hypothetical protein K505DRAFT_373167 [Melanomma pulvis-pyrius CBS 109.77]|uniref:Uncharacterized protein n=1 Tax=Melanomma pulvis-pyrius CBS 109.77 TaxID=1314802 RepID=A0A6A6XJ37_9PLEO|nr:hypothetical protein K505DRAFT_373167 [Melanomma pulvis-pyrius CBS 109.77]
MSTLPLELRDLILDFAIHSPLHPTLPLRRETREKSSLAIQYLVPSAQSTPTWLNLLLVNHQLHAETSFLLARSPPSYKLDMAVVNIGQWLWPTFRLIPPRIRPIIPLFDLNLILCHTEDEDRSFIDSTSRDYLGVWIIVQLKYFFRAFLSTRVQGDGDWPAGTAVIKTLRLNIDTKFPGGLQLVTNEEVPGRTFGSNGESRADPLYRYEKGLTKVVAEWLVSRMRARLRGENNKYRADALFFFRVGDIVVSVDGKDQENMDTSDGYMPAETDDESLAVFKRTIREKRKEYGL